MEKLQQESLKPMMFNSAFPQSQRCPSPATITRGSQNEGHSLLGSMHCLFPLGFKLPSSSSPCNHRTELKLMPLLYCTQKSKSNINRKRLERRLKIQKLHISHSNSNPTSQPMVHWFALNPSRDFLLYFSSISLFLSPFSQHVSTLASPHNSNLSIEFSYPCPPSFAPLASRCCLFHAQLRHPSSPSGPPNLAMGEPTFIGNLAVVIHSNPVLNYISLLFMLQSPCQSIQE